MQQSSEGSGHERDLASRVESLERELAAERESRRLLEERMAGQQAQILDLARSIRSILSSRIWQTLSGVGGRMLAIQARTSGWKRKILPVRSRPQNAPSASPVVSVLLPVYNTPEKWLRACIESVLRQTCGNWELCIADDCSGSDHVRRILEEYAARDARIQVTYRAQNGHIVAASNSCLEMARGDFVALLDHDDELAPDALAEVVAELARHPDTDILYTDEDKIDEGGFHFDPFYKPDWSPEYLLGCMYSGHLGVYRTALVRSIGGFRAGTDGAQDYDLMLRLTAASGQVRHIARVLYHWRAAATSTASGGAVKEYAWSAAQGALRNWLQITGRRGTVLPGPGYGTHRVCFEVPADAQTEILSISAAGISVDLLNERAFRSESEFLVFLHEEVRPVSADWVERLLEFCQLPGIGVVGPKLLTSDGRIHSAGVVFCGGAMRRAYAGHHAGDPGYYMTAQLARNCLAVESACFATKASVFRSAGGLDPGLPVDLSVIDYCLRLHQNGLRHVYTPYVEMTHTGQDVLAPADAISMFRSRWMEYHRHDPYYNLSLPKEFAYAAPGKSLAYSDG